MNVHAFITVGDDARKQVMITDDTEHIGVCDDDCEASIPGIRSAGGWEKVPGCSVHFKVKPTGLCVIECVNLQEMVVDSVRRWFCYFSEETLLCRRRLFFF